MKKSQALTLVGNLIHRVRTILPGIFYQHPGMMFSNHFIKHLSEIANDAVFRHVARLNYFGRFNKRGGCWIVLKDWIDHINAVLADHPSSVLPAVS